MSELTVKETFPHDVEEIENVWIPMSDGVRLAARIWRPASAHETPVPAVLEYLPYRKRDLMRLRDEPMHRYYAGHGYAALRVDVRGSGDSDGILDDEYSEQELADAVEVIAWIAAQPWCSGAVGMVGISWGGFNSLQVAARRPPALKAIMTLCASDDRYSDDAHYMGGCLINENQTWGTVLFAYNAFPPDPDISGAAWREKWLERLDAAHPFIARWLEHPRRDAYWKHGSVAEHFPDIECPVYAIGGWADAYSNSVPRLLEGLHSPSKGLVGPWSHMFPHDGIPGPVIGFLQEALRWWDHWLKGIDTGIMDEPAYRTWMQDSVPPEPTYQERPGRWVAEETWPSPRIETRRFALNAGRLDVAPEPEVALDLSSPQTTGLHGGVWCAFGSDGEMPTDQRPDDGRSLTFDSAPLEAPLEILGAPTLELTLALDKPVGTVVVRLNDVAPDGTSARVTYGVLNLTHRDSHESPSALVPGERYTVRVQLNDIAHSFPAGNSIRVAVSTSYWPIVWPAPEAAVLTLLCGASSLELPVRPPREADAALRAFQPPEQGPVEEPTALRPLQFVRELGRDLTSNETIYRLHSDAGELGGASLVRIDAIGLEIGKRFEKQYRIGESDPLSARMEVHYTTSFRRDDWAVSVDVRTALSATRDAFQLKSSLEAHEGETRIFSRRWDLSIPRDLV
jgi:putative CocE/NonD family hydrolase